MRFDDLLHQRLESQRNALDDAPLEIPLSQFPTLYDLETVGHGAKRQKAPGIDGNTSDTIKALLPWASKDIYMLFVKSWIIASEPLQFKVGHLHSIAKRPRRMSLENVRGTLALSSLGKLYRSMMRRQMIPADETFRLPTQLRGFGGQQTAYGMLLLRTYVKLAAAKGTSVAKLFVGVRHAFHALLRQHVFNGCHEFPQKLRDVLPAENIDFQSLLNQLDQHSACFREHVPCQTPRLVNVAHAGTWFTIQGEADHDRPVFETARGIADQDMAFNVLMSSVAKEIQDMLNEDTGILRATCIVGLSVPAVLWADDLALPLPCPSAEESSLCFGDLRRPSFKQFSEVLDYRRI